MNYQTLVAIGLAAFLSILVAIWSAAAHGQDVRTLNPVGTHAAVNQKLYIVGSGPRACLNVTLLASDPVSPAAGDFWCTDDGASVHKCCFESPGGTYCWDAIAE